MKEIQVGYVYVDNYDSSAPPAVWVVVAKYGMDSYIIYNPTETRQFVIRSGAYVRYDYFRKSL